MLDVAVAYNKYRFLGNEFLTWLWFIVENNQKTLLEIESDLVALEIGNRIVLENRKNNTLETITIKGDEAGLEEGILAIKKGAMVTEINLVLRESERKWQFNIKGESLNISCLKTPETAPVESKDDIEGAVLEKVYLYEKIITFIENIYKYFISVRVSKNWDPSVYQIKKWVLD